MDLKLKKLSLVQLIFLLVAFPSSSGRIFQPAKPVLFPRTQSNPTSKPSAPPTPSGASINEKECGRIVDNISLSGHPNQSHKVPKLCVRLNQTQLLNKLKNIGGFNPRYMAINKEDACRFRDLSGDEQPLPRKPFLFPQAKQDQPLNKQLETEMSASSLNDLKDETERLGPEIKDERRQKRMITLSPGSILRGCWSRGSVVDSTTLARLCTECTATTKLPQDVFPPFINEVICGDSDHHCFGPIGRCAQKVIKFTFLRRTGNYQLDDDLGFYVEEWEEFEQDIRSCCECRLFSFLVRHLG